MASLNDEVHLLQRATPSRQGKKAVLYNTQKQTQGVYNICKQKNMFLIKEQDKAPETNINETKTSSLHDKEF